MHQYLSVKLQKSRLRTQLAQKRESILPLKKNLYSQSIIQEIKKFLRLHSFQQLLFYYPLPHEVNIIPLIKELLPNTQLFLPKVFPPTSLKPCPITSLDNEKGGIQQGYSKIFEPIDPPENLFAPHIAAAFVPGLGFDKHKNRIGYGKGFYDRFLANYPTLVSVGVFFSAQLASKIPVEPQDRPLHFVVTEKGTF